MYFVPQHCLCSPQSWLLFPLFSWSKYPYPWFPKPLGGPLHHVLIGELRTCGIFLRTAKTIRGYYAQAGIWSCCFYSQLSWICHALIQFLLPVSYDTKKKVKHLEFVEQAYRHLWAWMGVYLPSASSSSVRHKNIYPTKQETHTVQLVKL